MSPSTPPHYRLRSQNDDDMIINILQIFPTFPSLFLIPDYSELCIRFESPNKKFLYKKGREASRDRVSIDLFIHTGGILDKLG